MPQKISSQQHTLAYWNLFFPWKNHTNLAIISAVIYTLCKWSTKLSSTECSRHHRHSLLLGHYAWVTPHTFWETLQLASSSTFWQEPISNISSQINHLVKPATFHHRCLLKHLANLLRSKQTLKTTRQLGDYNH